MTSPRPLTSTQPNERRWRIVGGTYRRAPPSILLVVLALAAASGQVWGGLYDVSLWGPVAIAVCGCVIGLFVARPAWPARTGALVVAALAGLAIASAASMLWAESAPRASLQAHRWALYAGLFALALLLMRDPRQRRRMLVVLGASGFAVMLGITAVLALGDASGLFFNMRLTEPLGYVNGQAAAIVMALWPAVALAERAPRASLRGLGAGAATLLLGLVLLTQSRGAVLALVIAAACVVALIPGRARRSWLLLAIAASVATVAGPLLGVYSSVPSARAQPDDEVIQDAVRLLLLAAVLSGAAWALATRYADAADDDQGHLLSRISTLGLAALAVVAVAGSIAAPGNPLTSIRGEIKQFSALNTDGLGQSRLLAGGGNRYDYWRVAMEEFRSAPVLGLGAGNYTTDYFRLRRTSEDIQQPHSLELQLLSELGVLGGVLVAGLIGGLLWTCAAAARRVSRGTEDAGLVVAGTGIVVSWIAHTSVDWLHLLPSLTAVMLCAAAALVLPVSSATRRPNLPAMLAVVVLTVLAAAGIGRVTLADRLRSQGSEVLVNDPARALVLADRAHSLQRDDVETLYLRAAALARRDDYEGARRTLLRAAASEPHNFVPHGLLGDLAVRRGDLATARREYAAARQLNPRDPTLRAAAAAIEAP